MVLVDAGCYVAKKVCRYVWKYRGTKKTFVDHQPSAKTLITLHVMFSAIFSTVSSSICIKKKNNLLFLLRDRFVSTKNYDHFLPLQSVTLF